jgi:DNA-directed RNA polymerase III subunit RPC7
MSRGGRGGRGRGFGRGRGGMGAGNMPPMGLTFADIQSLSREEDALYPVRCYTFCVIYSIPWNNML